MYTVTFKSSARKELYALRDPALKRVATAIEGLEIEPRPHGVKRLKGRDGDYYRIRVGDYRIIYLVDDPVLIVRIHRIGHRKDVYDKD